MTLDDVGNYYLHDDGTVWRLVGYAAEPTATLEKVERPPGLLAQPERRGGVVGAPIFSGFRRLVPDEGQ